MIADRGQRIGRWNVRVLRLVWGAAASAWAAGCGLSGEPAGLAAGGGAGGAGLAARVAVSPVRAGRAPPAEELGQEPSLDEFLRYAALRNPGLEAAFDRWKAAMERIPQVTALPDPRFTYNYYIEEVETRVGAQRQSAMIAQMFPWFGKLALAGDAAALAAEAARQRYEAARLRLFYQVKNAWYEHYYLWRAIEVTRENLELLKHFETVARTRYKVAAIGHPDVLRVQVELGKVDDRLRGLIDLRGPVAARLNAALNRPAEAPVPWPKKVPAERLALSDEQLLAELAENSPMLKALDAETAGRKVRIDLARKEHFPDVTLGVTYIDTARSTMSNPPDSGKDPIIATVSINLPVWWEKYAAGVREARRLHDAARLERIDQANLLSAEVKLAVYGLRDAGRKIDLYGATLLPKARQSIQATETAFLAAKGSFLDLIDAQRVLLEFALAHERALATAAQRLAELEMLVGRPLAAPGPATQPAPPATAPATVPQETKQ